MNLNRRVQSEETGYGLQFTSTQLHVLTKSHPSGFNFLVWKYVDGTGWALSSSTVKSVNLVLESHCGLVPVSRRCCVLIGPGLGYCLLMWARRMLCWRGTVGTRPPKPPGFYTLGEGQGRYWGYDLYDHAVPLRGISVASPNNHCDGQWSCWGFHEIILGCEWVNFNLPPPSLNVWPPLEQHLGQRLQTGRPQMGFVRTTQYLST